MKLPNLSLLSLVVVVCENDLLFSFYQSGPYVVLVV